MIIPWYAVLAGVLGYLVAAAFFARSRFTQWAGDDRDSEDVFLSAMLAIPAGLVWPFYMVGTALWRWFSNPLRQERDRKDQLQRDRAEWYHKARTVGDPREREVAQAIVDVIDDILKRELGVSAPRPSSRGPRPKPYGGYRPAWDDEERWNKT